MEKALHRRNSFLLFMVVISMVLMAACDSTPATPVPGPTATKVQSSNPVDPTATTVANVPTPTAVANVPVTPATKGSLSSAKAGSIILDRRREPKGELSAKTLQVAGRGADLNALEARNTATPIAQATPTEEVGTDAGDAPEDWSVVLDSDFSDGDSGTWMVGDAGDFGASIEDGKLVMTASDGAGFFNWSDETVNWDDGYISAKVELDGAGVVGLSARVLKTEGKFSDIVCIIGNSGGYGCFREIDGKNENVGSGRSSAIKKNVENEIALLGIGEDFTFFINGKKVRSFSGEGVTEGAWGTYLESPAGETTNAAFSRILFMGPSGDIDEPTPEPDITATPEEDVTATPEEDVTATTEPDEPTATVAPVDEDVVVSTDFSEGEGTWLIGEGDTFLVGVQDGELVVASTTAGGVVATAPDEAMDLTDARIEATFRIEETSGDQPGLVGVSARSQEFASDFEDWSQVFCGINNDGDYSCNRLTQSDEGIQFKEVLHGQTDSINAGEQNTIALTSKGSRWTFEINGSKVGSFTDNSQKNGAWGVLVTSRGDSTTGFFSNVSIFNR
jgi:hypothetical protein